MNAREVLRLMIRKHEGSMTVWSKPEIDAAFARYDEEHRAEILAEAKIEVVAWLVKKAREERAGSTREDRVRAAVIGVLASKVERGAIRPDNLRMLPASFFEPGRSYVSGTWQFRCEAITPSPGTGEIRALGWKRAPVHGVHLWHAVALDPDDWAHGGWADVTEAGDGS